MRASRGSTYVRQIEYVVAPRAIGHAIRIAKVFCAIFHLVDTARASTWLHTKNPSSVEMSRNTIQVAMRVADLDATSQQKTVTQSAPRIHTYVGLETETSGVTLADECATKPIRTSVVHSIGEGVAT